jgi:DNA-binding IclR family transcriptional regulator
MVGKINEKSLLTRGLKVIDAISASDRGLSFSGVSSLLGEPSPSTVNKILKELLAGNIIQKADSGDYILSEKVAVWGRAALAGKAEYEIIHNKLEALSRSFSVTAKSFIRVSNQIMCVDGVIESNSPALMSVGKREDINLGVLGGVFFLTADERENIQNIVNTLNREHPEIDDKIALSVMENALKEGIEDDGGKYYPGIRRLSVPIIIGGEVRYTIGVGMIKGRAKEISFVDKTKKYLLAAKKELEIIIP